MIEGRKFFIDGVSNNVWVKIGKKSGIKKYCSDAAAAPGHLNSRPATLWQGYFVPLWEMTVRFWTNARNTPYIETKPVLSSQMVVERKEDGSAIFQINVCHNFELEKVMLEFGEDIKVLSPRSLVAHIRKRLKLAAAQYE